MATQLVPYRTIADFDHIGTQLSPGGNAPVHDLFSDVETGLSDGEIRDLEGTLGFAFPEDFKQYLREINGGWLTDSADFGFGGGHLTAARNLYGFNASEDRDIPTERRGRGYVPPWLLPIGDDLGGSDLFVMDLRPDERGHIYIRAINVPPNEDQPILPPTLFDEPEQAALYHRVANSFSDLLDLIAGRATA